MEPNDPDIAILEDEEENEFDSQIDEEYRIWKKNTPYLYDLIIAHALEWPSLSVQWLSDIVVGKNTDYAEQKVYLTTHTSEGEQNYIMQATVQLPLPGTEIDMREYDNDGNENAGYNGLVGKVTTTIRINHDGEVNKARYMPQDPMIVATKAINSDVNIFDIRKHPSEPRDSLCHPNMIMKGHDKEGYGLSWSPIKRGYLGSGSDDKKVCLWDIYGNAVNGNEYIPIKTYTEQEDIVEDVCWHFLDENILGSCGDDCNVVLYDIRQNPSIEKYKAHNKEVNCLSFHPTEGYLLITGSSDNSLALWDLRNLRQPIHSLYHHTAEVFSVAWSPFSPNIVASAGVDRRVMLWDISKIGRKQTEEEAKEGPPELLFVHAGHTAKVNDISWNMNDEWTLASVGDDNVLQIWQPAEPIYNEEYGKDLDINDIKKEGI